MKLKLSFRNFLLRAGSIAFATSSAHAASGSWLGDSAGNWSDGTKWTSGTVADGADSTATFGNVITLDRIITLDTNRIIGNITASDTTNNYTISGANILTLERSDATKPTINVITSGRALTIGSVIAGNDGLLKSGAGTLIFNSTSNNTFTGGFDIIGGVVQYDSATNANAWGDAANVITFTGSATLFNNNNGYTLARSIQVNGTNTATLSGAFGESTNITGAVNGTGDVNISGGSNGWAVTMSNVANNISGTVWVSSNAGQNTALTVNSLADGADNTKRLKMGATTATADFTLQGTSATPLVWSNRAVELAGTTGAISISNNSSNAARSLTISPNLLFTAANSGNKTLTLAGSNLGTNTFAGNITNNGSSTTAITKSGAGIWALGGSNNYSGDTNLAASGTTGVLIFQGAQSLSANTTLKFAQNSSNVQSVRFLDDGGTPGIINFNRPIEFGGSNTLQTLNIAVGNNNTNNGGSSTGTTTGRTIQVGNITFTSIAADTNTTTINATSPNSNGYRLQTGTITLNNLVNRTAGQTTVTALNPTSANMTVAAITMAAGNAGPGVDGIPTLRLTGTSTDNYVTGAISESSVALPVQKQGTGNWTLLGTNTYTGNTAISSGRLEIGGSGTLGSGAYAATISIANTSSGTFKYNSTSNQTLSGVISGAGAVVKDSTGRLTLSNDNSYTGATTVDGGTLEINGAGDINQSATITVNAGGSLIYNSSTALTKAPTLNGIGTGPGERAVLGGTGPINVAITLDNLGDTLSPGNSPGILSFGVGQNFSGFSYDWELNDWSASVAGTNIDQIQIAGALDLSASTANQYMLNILSLMNDNTGGMVGAGGGNTFSESDRSWTILTASGGITGFAADEWNINPAGFTDAEAGMWSISQNTNNLVLTYSSIPEPGAALLGSMGLLLILRRRR